ncbi:hypothetical protein ACRHK7_01235 [Weissella tructae]|uniref:hypothetical protein n=1 Tax=Weissella tructae TaxID=887702 RepID=UPI003D91AAB4
MAKKLNKSVEISVSKEMVDMAIKIAAQKQRAADRKNNATKPNELTNRMVAQLGLEGTVNYYHGAIVTKLFTYQETMDVVELESALEDLKEMNKLHPKLAHSVEGV